MVAVVGNPSVDLPGGVFGAGEVHGRHFAAEVADRRALERRVEVEGVRHHDVVRHGEDVARVAFLLRFHSLLISTMLQRNLYSAAMAPIYLKVFYVL